MTAVPPVIPAERRSPSLVLNAAQVLQLLPQRPPFLFVDGVERYEVGVSLSAIKAVSIAEPCFAGHFPEQPVFPGVLVIEALAQSCALFSALEQGGWQPGGDLPLALALGDRVGVLGAVKVSLLRPVLPGTLLHLSVKRIRQVLNVMYFEVAAYKDSEVCACGSIVVATVSREHLVPSDPRDEPALTRPA